MENISWIAPLVSALTTIVMASYAIGNMKSQFATKGDVLDLERKLNAMVIEKNKDITNMVSKQEFNSHQDRTDSRMEAMSSKIDEVHRVVLTMAARQGIKG
jgi:hypothetical protein